MQYNAPIGAADPNDPFVDGNPANGTPGSPVPAAAIEHTQREIVAAIEAAGLTPDPDDLGQLAAAIAALIAAKPAGLTENDLGGLSVFANSLTSSGYQKLPGGLIIQWGMQTENTATAGGGSVVFPITFPNGLLQLIPGAGYLGGTESHDIGSTYISATSDTGFTWTATSPAYTTNIRYLALGH